MVGLEAIGRAMGDIIAPDGTIVTDEAMADANLKRMLGSMQIDPDAVFQTGNGIMLGAVQMGLDPENAVVQAFAMGVAIGAYLRTHLPETD